MAFSIRTIEYFRATVKDEPGEGFALLSALASESVSLVAFTAVPHGTAETELTLFPESATALTRAAASIGIPLDGPHRALFVQGDNELGAAAEIHRVLAQAGVNVIASTGLADTCRTFGYLIHLREADIPSAVRVLGEAFTLTGA